MAENLVLTHERVDDIPVLIGLAQKLHLPEILDPYLGNHGHHQGLSNGWLTTVWLAYILSEGDHRKSSVQQWSQQHRQTLERLIGQPIREVEFNVERLSMSEAVIGYRDGWCLERDFHLLKERPLGISPLYVRRDDQIIGLTHLLTLALRLQTLLEMQLRQQVAEAEESRAREVV